MPAAAARHVCVCHLGQARQDALCCATESASSRCICDAWATIFWLASQVKALVQLGRNLNRDSVARAGFLLRGHVPEPHTPFCEIRAVPAGHYVEVHDGHNGEVVAKRWFDLSETMAVAIERGSDPLTRKEDLALAMRDTVAAHRIADVPVGVFLSAGLDSTTLAALMCESTNNVGPVESVTLALQGIAGSSTDEASLAEAAARMLNTRHNTVWVSRADFESEDYFVHLKYGGDLGGFKTGSIFAHGLALFPMSFPLIYFVTCIVLFLVWDMQSRPGVNQSVELSPLIMLSAYRLFTYGITSESISITATMPLRTVWQSVAIYVGMLFLSRLAFKPFDPLAASHGSTRA